MQSLRTRGTWAAAINYAKEETEKGKYFEAAQFLRVAKSLIPEQAIEAALLAEVTDGILAQIDILQAQTPPDSAGIKELVDLVLAYDPESKTKIDKRILVTKRFQKARIYLEQKDWVNTSLTLYPLLKVDEFQSLSPEQRIEMIAMDVACDFIKAHDTARELIQQQVEPTDPRLIDSYTGILRINFAADWAIEAKEVARNAIARVIPQLIEEAQRLINEENDWLDSSTLVEAVLCVEPEHEEANRLSERTGNMAAIEHEFYIRGISPEQKTAGNPVVFNIAIPTETKRVEFHCNGFTMTNEPNETDSATGFSFVVPERGSLEYTIIAFLGEEQKRISGTIDVQ